MTPYLLNEAFLAKTHNLTCHSNACLVKLLMDLLLQQLLYLGMDLIESVSFTIIMYCIVPSVPYSLTISMDPSTTATSITISWSISIDSVVDSYEVMWSSDQCPNDVDEGDTIINDGSTGYTINNLREGTSYIITVIATNRAGTSLPSEQVTIQTIGIGN